MEGLDGSACPAAFLWVWNGLGLLERFLARANCFGEPVLIEFGCLRFPPARRNVFGRDRDGLEAGFREGEGGSGRAQGLETDLLQGMGEEPALELNPVFGGAFTGLEFSQNSLLASHKLASAIRLRPKSRCRPLVPRGVGRLMSKDGIIAFVVTKRLHLRHLHEVARWAVKGAAAAVLNVDCGALALHDIGRCGGLCAIRSPKALGKSERS
jgi:hypothetical protein